MTKLHENLKTKEKIHCAMVTRLFVATAVIARYCSAMSVLPKFQKKGKEQEKHKWGPDGRGCENPDNPYPLN